MTSKIIATASDDMMSVNVVIESNCPMVQKLTPIEGINPYEAIGTPFTESEIYKKAAECLRHTACPVPCGIVKAVEAESGMGLKKPVSITFE
ncbi:MAG: hypothetical protein IKQ93_06495 [Candidatus Methanomethylophilaceae archaeon]|nr:hypothetical protein [Candidatus Methanomethylophilaceae archaeon]MBR4203204.1 hypothetical protein [Candidatus Methanomethylophilaceae archaeon]